MYTYSYVPSSNTAGYNSWRENVTQTAPDGAQTITYLNSAGEVMLNVVKSGNQQWLSFIQFDSSGRIYRQANPSAVTGYDDSKADLLNSVSDKYQYLSDTQGLITQTDYYGSTSSDTGAVEGYIQDMQIQQGETGKLIKQSSATYVQHSINTDTATAATVTLPATQVVYSEIDGTGARTTTFSYDLWYGDFGSPTSTPSLRSYIVKVEQPPISNTEDGPGDNKGDTSYSVNDIYGNVIWTKDPNGFINYTAYDVGTGAVVKTIVDVNTGITSDYSPTPLPSDWSTTAGARLITTMQVDGLGRTTMVQEPARASA